MASIQDGTYDFVGSVMTAVRAPGVMREDVLAFQTLAKAVQAGEVSSKEAFSRAENIGNSFAVLWKLINENAGALTLIIAIIALYLQFTSNLSSDAGANQAHSDAERHYEISQQIRERISAIEFEYSLNAQATEGRHLTNQQPPIGHQKISRQQRRYLERQAKRNRH